MQILLVGVEKNMGNNMKNSHKPVKGAPMPGSGHSSLEDEKGKNEVTQPGQKKFGSNKMSPCAKEGRINEYGGK